MAIQSKNLLKKCRQQRPKKRDVYVGGEQIVLLQHAIIQE